MVRAVDLVTASRTAWWMTVARVLIKTRGFPKTAARFGFEPVPELDVPTSDPALTAEARRAVRVALAVLRLGRASCLPRAFAVSRILRAHGVDGDLLLGGAKEDRFLAHAWIEVSGTPIGYGEAGGAQWRVLGRFRAVQPVATGRADRAEEVEV